MAMTRFPRCRWSLAPNGERNGSTFENHSCGVITTISERSETEDISAESVAKSVLILVVVASSLVGNFFITVSYFQNFKMRTVTNTLVLNMSFADELSSLLDIPFYAAPLLAPQLLHNSLFCKVATFFDGFFKIASTLSMSGIAVDRHLYLFKTRNERQRTRRKQWMTRKRAKIIIAVSWVVALAASLPWDFGSHNCPRTTHGLFEPSMTLPSVIVFSKVAFIIVPFLAICLVLYHLLTLVRRRRTVHVVDDASVFSCSSAEHQAVRAYARSSITTVILLGMYALCTAPFCGAIIYSICVKTLALKAPLAFIFHLLFRLKSTLFPLVYVMRNRVILSLVQQKLDCCSVQCGSESSARNNNPMAFVVSRSNPSFNLYLHTPAGPSGTSENNDDDAGVTTDGRVKVRVSQTASNNGTVNFDAFTDLKGVKAADREVRFNL